MGNTFIRTNSIINTVKIGRIILLNAEGLGENEIWLFFIKGIQGRPCERKRIKAPDRYGAKRKRTKI